MSPSTPGSIEPGWYEDPQAPGMLRWFDGLAWSPRTKPHATTVTRVPQPSAPAATAPAPVPPAAPQPATPTFAAARATWLAADSRPIPIVQAPAPAPASAAVVPTPALPPAAVVPTPAPVAAPAPVFPAPAPRPAPVATQSVAAARAAARPAAKPAQPAAAAAATTFAPAPPQAPAPAWTAAATPTLAPPWPAAAARPSAPTAAAVPTQAPPPAQSGSLWLPTVEEPEHEPEVEPRPTGLRQLVGHLAVDMPAWLPASIAEPLSLRMVRYATSTSRFRDHVTGASLKRLVFPDESAWQASSSALVGILAIALSVWPLVGLGVWLVAAVLAGLAFLRLRREVLLGGTERAWFGLACGIGPLWTGILALAFR